MNGNSIKASGSGAKTETKSQETEQILSLIASVADLMNDKDLNKVQLSLANGITFTCEKAQPVTYQAPIMLPEAASSSQASKAESKSSFKEIKSDMVGTIYLAPSPTDQPYITVGSTIKEGQTIFIIDAMKVMNHFKAPFSGTVKEILVQNEQVVEYGQVLVRVS
jgi:acetyl-CoA carboxylase biotin carboxyl carrier protein